MKTLSLTHTGTQTHTRTDLVLYGAVGLDHATSSAELLIVGLSTAM